MRDFKLELTLLNGPCNARGILKYVRDNLDCQWPVVEYRLLHESDNGPKGACQYAQLMVGGRWIEAESYIQSSVDDANWYVRFVALGRWTKAEHSVITSTPWFEPHTERIYDAIQYPFSVRISLLAAVET